MLLVADSIVFCIGAFVVFNCIKHIAEGESTAEASLTHLGSVAGSPHLVALFFGISLMMSALLYLWKMYKGFSWHEVAMQGVKPLRDIHHSVTESGLKIRDMMRRKKDG